MLSTVCSRVKFYMENTSVHGFRYIVEKEAHWIEKLFWVIVCCSCLYGTCALFVATWNSYVNNAVSFVTETTYLNWNTTFPAVSICETEDNDKIYAFGDMAFGEERNFNLDSFVQDIVYFSGNCYSCSVYCGKIINCPEDLFELTKAVRSTCETMITHCTWNGKPFECCKNFEPLQTEFGKCYTINSLQTGRSKSAEKIQLISNRLTGPGHLSFHVHDSSNVYIHTPTDVPYVHHPEDETHHLFWGEVLTMKFRITDIVNDVMLQDVTVERRNCRFPHENPLTIYPLYSYSACIVECHASAQMRLCGCIHHLMPGQNSSSKNTCTIEGLNCLSAHVEELRSLKTSSSSKPGLMCNCTSSCTEPEIRITNKILSRDDPDDAEYSSEVTIQMESLPTERFARNVVRSKLDLVVSMGGTAGLFLGASLLSTIEIIYYCCIRRINILSDREDENKLTKSLKRDKTPAMKWPIIHRTRPVPSRDVFKYNGPLFYPRDYNHGRFNLYL